MPAIHWNKRGEKPAPKTPARMPIVKWEPPFHW